MNNKEAQEQLVYWQKQVEDWGQKVGLYDPVDGATVLTQKLKFYEEYGELCGSALKGKKDVYIDSIGDCFVVAVHLQKFVKNEDFKIEYTAESTYFMIKDKSKREIIDMIPFYINNQGYTIAVLLLMTLSEIETGNPFICFEFAYNEIKDRKGKMVKGSFVKEEDL